MSLISRVISSYSPLLDVKLKVWTSIHDSYAISWRVDVLKSWKWEMVRRNEDPLGERWWYWSCFIATSPTYYADILTRLFENIAVIIDQHQPLVELHYGKGRMLRVIQRLQEESDEECGLILDQFTQNRKLEAKVSPIHLIYPNAVIWFFY